MVLESKYGSPKIVNDGVTVAKEVELEDPVENIGAKLVRQVCLLGCSPLVYVAGLEHVCTGLHACVGFHFGTGAHPTE